MVKDYFQLDNSKKRKDIELDNVKIRKDINADEAVSKGAAILARNIIKKEEEGLEKLVVVDVILYL